MEKRKFYPMYYKKNAEVKDIKFVVFGKQFMKKLESVTEKNHLRMDDY